MPELPEVETFKRQLQPLLQGQIISKLKVSAKGLRMISPIDPQEFANKVVGRQIIDMQRKGKFLILLLDQELTINIHLRMSGRLVYSPRNIQQEHKRLEIQFQSGGSLNFIDIRRFGTFHLAIGPSYQTLRKLGPDILLDKVELRSLFLKTRNKKIAIHKLLLDQSFLAGAGNIYANEALFLSGIDPFRPAFKLEEQELDLLYYNLQRIMQKAINFKGTTLIDKSYKDSLGENGEFARLLNVYGKKLGPCPKCNNDLVNKKLGGRSVFFCPVCQK